jgi:hypothetical protein
VHLRSQSQQILIGGLLVVMLGVTRARVHVVNVVDRPLPKGRTEVQRTFAFGKPILHEGS